MIRGLFKPVDTASIVFFRVAFGAVMLVEVWRYFANGWIDGYYIKPTFFFKYYGFGWVQPWPGEAMNWHFIALGVLALFIMVGFLYRVSTILFFLGFTYVFLLDQTHYLNHFYLISLISLLLIFVPTHRAASVDSWLRPRIQSDFVPAWGLWLLRAQIGIAYFDAGLAKLNPDGLRGEPMRMWLASSKQMTMLGDFIPVGRLFTNEYVVYWFTYGGLLLDLFIVPCLLWRRTRPFAFAAAMLFHLLNAKLFDIGVFPWFALTATLLFFEPDWPRRIFNWPRSEDRSNRVLVGAYGSSRPRLTATLFWGFVAIQILCPLRHFLYPNIVHWSEEGHRFAWHMKLRSKSARARFVVTDAETGQKWTVKPSDYLTRRQYRKMAGQPDMILQFAHHLAEEYRLRGHAGVEVHAFVEAALNGRKYQPLIDPTVNLAAVKRSLGHATWITEPTEPLPAPKEKK